MAKLLIVDDDPAQLNLYRTRLADSYEIIDTCNSEAAFALALQHKPDCIILDLSLPHFSGFELCRALGLLSSTSLIPILVISGRPARMYEDFCLNLGAKEYFEKPVNFVRLRERLTEVLKHEHQERRFKRRAQLGVMLKLKLIGDNGNRKEFLTVSEDVSADGFLCACPTELCSGAILEVSMIGGGRERKVGHARMVRVEWSGTPAQRYGFQFVEKPKDWIFAEDDR